MIPHYTCATKFKILLKRVGNNIFSISPLNLKPQIFANLRNTSQQHTLQSYQLMEALARFQ